jgi:hypothetical protein
MADSDATTRQVRLPQLGESVSGGTIVAWLVERLWRQTELAEEHDLTLSVNVLAGCPWQAGQTNLRATDEQVAILLRSASDMQPDEGDVETLFAADCTFHSTILESTGNLMMRQMRPIILTVLKISYEFGVLIVDGERVTREGHIRVAEAIRDRNGAVAKSEMETMLERNRHTASRYWDSRR